jgi:hypothetical protein
MKKTAKKVTPSKSLKLKKVSPSRIKKAKSSNFLSSGSLMAAPKVKLSANVVVERNTELDELVIRRNACKAQLDQANKALAEKKAFYKKEL